MNQAHEARLIQKTEVTPTVVLVRFMLKEDTQLIFKSGQYVRLLLTSPDGQTVERPFSLASSPHRHQEFELLIRLLPTGIVSDFFRGITPGTPVNFLGPDGRFGVQNETHPMHFITSGVGIAPFRSMLHDLLFIRKTSAPIRLSFVRDSLPWASLDHELASWVEKCKNFVYSHIHSPADKTDMNAAWTGILLSDLHNTHMYLAGAPAFVAEGKAWLLKQGVPSELIFTEN